jgi:hypothetical protein
MTEKQALGRPVFVGFTEASRLFTTVKRMKYDREHAIPSSERDTHAISVETGKSSREMTDEEADVWYLQLCAELLSKYPHLYQSIFG